MTGIYLITNLTNQKVYVGQAINIQSRWQVHKKQLVNNTHVNQHFQRAWNKCGALQFSFRIIEECAPEQLGYLEQQYIAVCQSNKEQFGYNKTQGGGGILGYRHKRKAKQAIRNSLFGNKYSLGIKQSVATVNRRAAKLVGRKHSRNAKKKMRIAATDRKHTEATKEKIRNQRTGTHAKPETKLKLKKAAKKQWESKAFRDKMLPILDKNRRRKRSPETRAKISASKKGRKMPPEAVAKVAAANTGKKRSKETVANLRASLLVYWANLSVEDRERNRSAVIKGWKKRRKNSPPRNSALKAWETRRRNLALHNQSIKETKGN
jgi:group I intron endonuclease